MTNIHQKQQLHCVTNQALKLYWYLNMLHLKNVSFIQADKRRQLTVAESSHGSMLPWPSCVTFLMLIHFTESEKPLLLQRNFLYVMMQPAWHSTFISNSNGVCTPAPGLLGQGSFPPLQRVSEGQGRSCMERTAVSALRTAQAVMQRHLVNEQLKTWC